MPDRKPAKASVVLIGDLQARTMRQKEFVRHYLTMKKPNQTEAARLAGYKEPVGAACRLMKTPWIVKEISEAMEASNHRTKITIDDIREKLLVLLEGCMQKVPITDDEGVDTGLYKWMDATTARGCIKDLGEMVDVQAFVKNVAGTIHHTHSTAEDVDLSKLTVEEQKAMLALILKAKQTQTVDGPPKRIECIASEPQVYEPSDLLPAVEHEVIDVGWNEKKEASNDD